MGIPHSLPPLKLSTDLLKKVNDPARSKLLHKKTPVFLIDDSDRRFLKNAIIASFVMHLLMFFVKFPGDVPKHEKKAMAIKMGYVKPSEAYETKKREEIKKELAKKLAAMKPQAGASSNNRADTAPPTAPAQTVKSNAPVEMSKAGSEAKGATASAPAGAAAPKVFQFKGAGLKTLLGNSSKMTVGAVQSNTGIKGLASGVGGSGSKKGNLTGLYTSPTGTGDGSGHVLGKDTEGSYDRSSKTRGLASKNGIDTAHVQAETEVKGSIDPEVLKKILQEYLNQFKFCYQKELEENSEDLKGIVDLKFRIEADGKVSTVNITSASKVPFSAGGIGCMSNILKMIPFPKPKGGGVVDVRQPLNFTSESTKI